MPNVAAVTAKLEAMDAEPAPDAPGAPPPEGEGSGAGSASVDASGGTPAGDSPAEATTPEAIEAKLHADRERRQTKAERRQARLDRDRAAKLAKEAEDAKKAAEEERAKWSKVGKDKPWLETLKELGKDPREVFEEMRNEALKAGTPEARIEALEKAYTARLDALENQLKEERTGREAERKTAAQRAEAHAFQTDFHTGMSDARFASLLDEYEPVQLYGIAEALKNNPPYLFQQAEELGVELTDDEGEFTMMDILSVMKATQDRHRARQEQRRQQSAAPQPSVAAPTQAPAATKPTVNGTAERNAGNTIRNDLAATRASEGTDLSKMTRDERRKFLERKYG